MPTYAYACAKCNHTFEAFQSIKAKPLRECPACGQNALKRLIGTGAGIIFKGSGFYCTDYRSDSYKTAAKSDMGGTSTKSDTAKTTDAKSETKAEPKAKEPKKKSA